MRLLEIDDRDQVHLTSDLNDHIPEYAILSHTWGHEEDEVTYRDIQNDLGKDKQGYAKIRFCIEQCRKDSIQHFWVDTCCIDKSNSIVVSRAIASMYEWYKRAKKCYVFLSDVAFRKRDSEGNNSPWESAVRESKWFTRGWTLQELLAPTTVEFFSREGDHLGDKKTLEELICKITKIPLNALRGAPMVQFTEHERFRWADHRETKYPEDESYCLQGLFDVYISTSYGEGWWRARARLKDEINRLHRKQLDRIEPAMDTSISGGISRHGNTLASNNSNKISLQDRRRMLLESLSFVQMDARRATIKKEHSKTCRWLLDHPTYLDWTNPQQLDQHCGFLWINGKPGAGKSTLMKFAHADADKKRHNPEILVSFFFNSRGDELEKSTIGMYRALLFQLFDKAPDLQQLLDNFPFASTHSSQGPVWTVESLCELFSAAAAALGQRQLKCFVDALDECDENEVQEMVDFFIALGKKARGNGTQLYVCFASRPYPILVIESGLQLTLEDQQGHGEDLAKYVQSHLRGGKGKEIEELRRQVQEKANGVFMWAVLVVDILNKELTRGRIFAVEERLKQIPDKLSDLFKDILRRDRENMPDLLLCLQWILFAKRPLRREEFYYGMVAGLHPQQLAEWDPEHTPIDAMDRFVLSSSKGLAELTKSKKSTVQFIHESVRDFLTKDSGLLELWRELQPDLRGDVHSLSHDKLKRCCQTYLNNINHYDQAPTDEVIPKAKSQAGKDLRQALTTKFPFLEYACRHVLYHANEAAANISQANFLKDFPLGNWIRVTNLVERHDIRRHTSEATILYILAEQNCARLISTVPERGSMINIQGERYQYPLFAALANGHQAAAKALLITCNPQMINFADRRARTALSIAAEHGNEEIVGLLLEIDGIKIDPSDRQGFTPLSYAALSGQIIIAKLLLENRANIQAANFEGLTALHTAAGYGHTQVVQLLLENGADINAADINNLTALHTAAGYGHTQVVKLLVENGANINAVNIDGLTALHTAAGYGHTLVVKLLIENGANINSVNIDGLTALHTAAKYEYTQVVRLLLEQGANIEAKDCDRRTALLKAAISGHIEVVQLLLEQGANIEAEDYSGGTALFRAAASKHIEVVQLLLEQGANTEAKDYSNGTALVEAAKMGHIEVIQLLLESGASIEGTDYTNRTVLVKAAEMGYTEVVQLLLENGANIEATDPSHQTALVWATRRGHIGVIRLLLEKGANINATDKYGWTALTRAAEAGCIEAVQLLLEKDANIEVIDTSCQTALAWAARRGHIEVIQLLLEKGVNINATDEYGCTALTQAAEAGHIEAVRLLLEKDANIEVTDPSHQTALVWAARMGHIEVIRLLLEKGANINATDKYGCTALTWAAEAGHIEAVQLLLEKNVYIDATDQYGRTASDLASSNKHAEIVQLLRERRGKI